MRIRLIAVVITPAVLVSTLSLTGQSRATNTGSPNVQVPGNASATAAATRYVGSEACRKCHLNVYNGWKQTRMANVVRDPREHPEAVLGDFAHSDPLRTFDLDQVAFAYGSRYKQRYFTKRGDDYFPLPAQWDVKKKRWLPYHVEPGTDWWVPFYGSSNLDRPTGPTCDGCHSVNYDIRTKHVTEWNVGCEKCHGPGSEHVAHPLAPILSILRVSSLFGETMSAFSATARAVR